KAVRRLATRHRRVASQRANTLHQFTSRLAKTKSVVVIEDLTISGMRKNHHLAQAPWDVGGGERRRQLAYETAWYGSRVIVATRQKLSSKTCSGRSWQNDGLLPTDRLFRCERCGLPLDRDVKVAITLAKRAGRSSERRNACGEDGAGQGR